MMSTLSLAQPSLLSAIGNTPLVAFSMETKASVYAKLEYLNPGGSIKDRAALFMIEEAEHQGLLKPGGTIVEATSGNQGIALAMIGALKGYNVIITVPDRTSEEKRATLQAYGAKVYMCPDSPLSDPNGYHTKAEELHKSIPGSFMPNQYFNTQNKKAHYLTTGPEIWQQTEGKVTHCIIGMGTCGTISGIGSYLKEQNPNIHIVGVDAATSVYSAPEEPLPYKVEGIGVDVVTEMVDRSIIDEVLTATDDESFAMTKHLAGRGHLVGLSSGAVVSAAEGYIKGLGDSAVVVLLFADSGRAYLSKMANYR
jgi:cystathionine beta-synthase